MKKLYFASIAWILMFSASLFQLPSEAAQINPLTKTSYFSGPCAADPNTPQFWKKLDAQLSKYRLCTSPYRHIPVSQSPLMPRTNYVSESPTQVDSCKIDNYRSGRTRAFGLDRELHLNPNTKVQIVPLYASDSAPGTGNPARDYSGYIKYLKDFVTYISDGQSSFSISSPNKYFKLKKPLVTYKNAHQLTETARKDFVEAVDAGIDFTDVDYAFIVYPPGTNLDIAAQVGGGGILKTAEGDIGHVIAASPLTYKLGDGFHTMMVQQPMNLLHEFFHPGAALEDHVGSNYWQNGFAGDPNEPGMGNWGLMAQSKTDLITWEKWLLGFTMDSQVYCLDNLDKATNFWLSPSGVKTTNKKLLVMKISDHEVLVAESARAAGFNFKLPKSAEGAVVYTVNTEESRVEYGLKIIRPAGTKINSQPFILSNASLQKGEFITYKGFRVQVVEAGPFGDVVTVSRTGK